MIFLNKENKPTKFNYFRDKDLGVDIKYQKLYVRNAADEDDETDIEDL